MHNSEQKIPQGRSGKVLVLFAVLLPAMLAVTGLIIDGGVLQGTYRRTQHVSDAAATAAARNLQRGLTEIEAVNTAEQFVQSYNGLPSAEVTVNIPPTIGLFAGDANCVEVEVSHEADTHFYGFIGGESAVEVRTRSVAGLKPSSAGAAIVVLDPDPPPLSVPPLPAILPALPALIGGFEIEGLGTVRVDGAVLVNTEWGGFDENGDAVGSSAPPPFGIASINLLTPQRLRARDIRVVGGVDNPGAYGNFVIGDPSPLVAGRLPVPDPLLNLPVPTTAVDPVNVDPTLRGGVNIVGLPLLGWQTLNPGVYEWIQVTSGRVRFNPGIYIIRNVNPVTQMALNFLAGEIDAQGVMFYITNSPGYSPASGLPDANDGSTVPPAPGVLNLLPSSVVNLVLPTCRISGLNDPDSPFHGITIYQRRTDRRPIALVTGLLGGPGVEGTVYAKWGHIILASRGTVDCRFVGGTVRIVTTLPTTIAPSQLVPPATDVYLLE
jgi:hypothetical protein